MIKLTLTPDKDLCKWEQELDQAQGKVLIAYSRALNKTARWLRTRLASDTAKELDIKVGLIRSGLRVVPAKRNRLEVVIGLDPKSGVVKAAKLGRATQNKRGVKAGKRQFDHAFLATMPNGHTGVFRRRGKTRFPIQEVQIVFTGRLKDAMDDMMDGQALAHFDVFFERELRYLVRS